MCFISPKNVERKLENKEEKKQTQRIVLLNYVLRQIFYLITIFFVALLKNK